MLEMSAWMELLRFTTRKQVFIDTTTVNATKSHFSPASGKGTYPDGRKIVFVIVLNVGARIMLLL